MKTKTQAAAPKAAVEPSTKSSLIPHAGVQLFSRFQHDLDGLVEDFRKGIGDLGSTRLSPAVEFTETDNQLKISAELPGLTAKDVDVRMDGDALVISGEKSSKSEESGQSFRVTERTYGAFARRIPLPRGVDSSAITARMSNGVLEVTAPKPPAAEQQTIQVQTA